MSSKYDRAIEMLDRASRWIIVSHKRPDGDTLGCAGALARLAMRISKESVIWCPDDIPDRYAFLTLGVEHAKVARAPNDASLDGAVFICVDTSTLERSVDGLPGRGPEVLNIDHHPDNEQYGDVDLIDRDASSTGEVVVRLMEASPWGIEKDEAEALYVAMVTDNGDFRYASTSVSSHECAIALLRAGVRPDEIADKLVSRISIGTLRLWAAAYSKVELVADGRGAVMHIDSDDLEATGTTKDDLGDIVNDLLRVDGVRICALASPAGDGKAKVSVRSREPLSARMLATRFGGGGHELASGCTIDAPVPAAIEQVKEEMERLIGSQVI